MSTKSAIVFSAILILLVSAPAHAEGEAMLALTGQYTFFIKPEPGSCVTYYQKMVPCVLKETVLVPKRVVQTFPMPFTSKRAKSVLRHETPVGCAEGAGPCLQCYPRPSCRSAMTHVQVPVMKPVRVRGLEAVPKCVTRRVMRPQWFQVTETPKPLRKVRKVHRGG